MTLSGLLTCKDVVPWWEALGLQTCAMWVGDGAWYRCLVLCIFVEAKEMFSCGLISVVKTGSVPASWCPVCWHQTLIVWQWWRVGGWGETCCLGGGEILNSRGKHEELHLAPRRWLWLCQAADSSVSVSRKCSLDGYPIHVETLGSACVQLQLDESEPESSNPCRT